MAKLFNLAKMTTATTGTGTLTLGSAVSGFLSFASAGVTDGAKIRYSIRDGAASEIGTGTYTSSGTTLTRTVLKSTNSNNAINLSGTAVVSVTVAAEDIRPSPYNFSIFDFVDEATVTAGTDISTQLQAAITATAALTGMSEGPAGLLVLPSNYTYRIDTGITINTPIGLHIYGKIDFRGTGNAFTIDASDDARNYGGDYQFMGPIVDYNGNTSLPTSVNTSGTCGVRVKNMQFGNLRVMNVRQFTYAGVFFDCTGGVALDLKHVQDCDIYIGKLAYNGAGLKIVSADAAYGAFQVNRVALQNSFSNFINLDIDNPTEDDTSNNLFDIAAMDAAAPGGTCVRMEAGNYNHFRIGYIDGTLYLGGNTNDNYFWIGNDTTTALTISDAGENWVETAGAAGAKRIYSPKYTFEGGALAIDGDFTPITDGVNAIGSGTKRWTKLYLESTGEIDFGNANARIIHSTDLLTVSGRFAIDRPNADNYCAEFINSGTGDPAFHLLVSGTAEACIGIDRSDSNKVKISNTGDVGSGTQIEIDPSGGTTKAKGLGHLTGVGGTVTQATSKSTGVTLSKRCGAITMNNAALAASTSVSFTLTNTTIGANDVVMASIASAATAGAYTVTVDAVASGSCRISLRNVSGGSLSEAVVINFVVVGSVTS